MVESLQVNDKDPWESVDRQTFLDVNRLFAPAAFESGSDHFLAFHEFVETVLYLNTSSEADSSPWDLYAQVHEVIKRKVGMLAAHAGCPIHQLTREEVYHY